MDVHCHADCLGGKLFFWLRAWGPFLENPETFQARKAIFN